MASTIIGFGASTVEGVGDSQGGWFKRAERLALQRGKWLNWINQGRGGQATAGMLARAGTLAQYAPYDLVVLLGCNDLPRRYDNQPGDRTRREEYEQNLSELLPRVKGERSLFISSFPIIASKVYIDDETFSTYVETAMRVAKKSGYEVWDLYRELNGSAEPYWADDGLHFNDAGHEYIARGFIERWLK